MVITDCEGDAEYKFKYWERRILCRRLNKERGIVRVRVASVPRFTEIQPYVL
jgi:hypothetical protein